MAFSKACVTGGGTEASCECQAAKIDALESVINEAAGEPVLVAYHFRSDLERLQWAFPRAGKHERRCLVSQPWQNPLLWSEIGRAHV